MTPLHFACKYGNENIVNLLIKKGVSLHCKDSDETTPVLFAASEGHENVSCFLCEFIIFSNKYLCCTTFVSRLWNCSSIKHKLMKAKLCFSKSKIMTATLLFILLSTRRTWTLLISWLNSVWIVVSDNLGIPYFLF